MTEIFNSERGALEGAAVYAGYRTREEIARVLAQARVSERNILPTPLALILPADKQREARERMKVYTFPAQDESRQVSVTIGTFREGFDCWLVNLAKRTVYQRI